MLFNLRSLGLLLCLLAGRCCLAQEVALTFDDLPETGVLPRGMTRADIVKDIAKTLKDAQAPRVYGFVNGIKVGKSQKELDMLKTWTAAGFPLANHGYSHLNLAETSIRRYVRDIKANEPLLKSLVAKEEDWHWYRYPYLEEGETRRKKAVIADFLKENHYRVAEVTLDFEDFLWTAPYARCLAKHNAKGIEWLKQSYLAAAEERIELGRKMSRQLYSREIKYIMLLHVGAFETVALPDLLKLLSDKKFKLVTLEEAAADPAYQTDHGWVTRRGGDFLTLTMHSRDLEIPPHEPFPRRKLNAVCR